MTDFNVLHSDPWFQGRINQNLFIMISINRVINLLVLFYASTIYGRDLDFGNDFFEKKIRPVLVKNCYECHSAKSEKLKAGLFLDRKAGWLRGGKSGQAIIPSKPRKSLLLSAIRYKNLDLQMPPSKKLPDSVVKDFEKWILMGAPDPRDVPMSDISDIGGLKSKSLEEGRKFWSFKPIQMVSSNFANSGTSEKDVIDRLVLKKIENTGLNPSVKAKELVLLRRVYFDLVGMPPSPEQIEDFLNDSSVDPFKKVVNSLLASSRFGEHWGRHWLDVARYADTTGGGRNNPFPNAKRYRDYVINSFNEDKPFNRFILEQIAGDLMVASSDSEYNENLTGTGFLALGPHNYELQDKELLRMEVVDEQLSSIGRAFMGVTLGCARCHDHPFDPIPTKDYYSMAGIFRSTNSLVPGNVASFHERELKDDYGLARKNHAHKKASLEKKLKEANAKLKLLGGAQEDSKDKGRSLDPLSLDGIVVDDTEAKKIGKWISSTHTTGFVGEQYLHDDNQGKGNKSLTFTANVQRRGKYEVQVSYTDGPNRSKKTPITIMHANGEQKIFIDQTLPPSILGSFTSLGVFMFDKREKDVVQITTEGTSQHVIVDAIRLVPIKKDFVTGIITDYTPIDSRGKEAVKGLIEIQQKRVAGLKKSLQEHKEKAPPKVRKVMSIREQDETGDWHIHLRGGIRNLGPVVPRGFLAVATPPDLSPNPQIPVSSSGRLEFARWIASPKNPLTARVFVNRVWHHLFGRGIVGSTDNFGEMGSRPTHPELLDYLARFFINNGWSTKTLIRQIVLTKTYQMSSSPSPLTLKKDPDNQLFSRQNRRRLNAEAIRDAMLLAGGQISFENSPRNENRSLFVEINRNKIPEIFEVFDYPNPGLVSGNRNASTVPTQALFMMNNDFVIKQASIAAKNIFARKYLMNEQMIKSAFLTCLAREPTQEEKKLINQFLGDEQKGKLNEKAMEGLVHSLFACLDFRYLH